MENDIVRMLFLRRQRQKKRWKIKTISGSPPLSFKAKAGTLKNYRIYGNTVSGESVGDRTGNLFDMSSVYAIGYIDDSGNIAIAQGYAITTYDFIPIDQNSSYSIKICGKLNDNTNQRKIRVAFYDRDQIFISRTGLGEASDVRTFNAINNSHYIRISIDDGNTNIMLNEGSTALPYEPYGYKVPVTVEGKNLFDNSKTANILKCYLSVSTLVSSVNTRTIFIECKPSTTYTVSKILGNRFVVGWSDKLPAPGVKLQEKVINYNASSITITTGLAAKYLVAYIYNAEQDAPITADEMIASVQIEKGSTATPYEPYHAPVTTPIYLPEPIKMVGDEAEYVDYGEQKLHRVGADDIDVTLPELPTVTGTNVLSVETAVQPSGVEITGRIKKGE